MTGYWLTLEAIISRRRSFLERPEWRNILHADGETYTLSYGLGGIAIRIPGLCEDVIHIASLPEADPARLKKGHETVQALSDVLDRLRKWWERWRADPDRLPVRISQIPADAVLFPPPSISETFLSFPDLESAAVFCRFHSHAITALRWIGYLLKMFPALELAEEDSEIINPAELAETILKHAGAILDALPFYGLPQYVHIGATYMGLPARVAWQSFAPESPEALWIEELMDRMAQRSGFKISRHALRDVAVICERGPIINSS